MHKNRIIIFFLLLFPLIGNSNKTIPVIKHLQPGSKDPVLLHWKKMIQHNLRRSRQKPYIALTNLQFARYKVKKEDSLWFIISSLSLDVDTIAQINQLSSIYDIKAGDWLLIPNMRGTFRAFALNARYDAIGRKWKVPSLHIASANKTPIIYKKNQFLFLPGTKMTSLERELFYGTAFLAPLKKGKGTISSKFGPRKDPFTNKDTFHGGLDIAAQTGTSVYAARTGQVIYTGWAGGYGKLIILKHSFGYQTYYGHLSKILVKKNQKVYSGTLIGRVGNTGKSTGPHLHFEIRRKGRFYNPQKYIHSLKHK